MPENTKTILITGAAGALGRYAQMRMKYAAQHRVIAMDRQGFANQDALVTAIGHADVILHLAGVNRATEEEVGAANPAIATALVAALTKSGHEPHVIYSSSLHEQTQSTYGTSKREAGDIIEAWASRAGAKFTRLLLPHIYSELVRPDYNSGIATFCNRLANNAEAEIQIDAEICPLHASEVCDIFDLLIDGVSDVEAAPLGRPWRMSDILADIRRMHESYMTKLIVPDLREVRNLHLFNTYRAHLYPQAFPVFPVLHTDNRGSLFEAVRECNGGQTFLSTTVPGITRGNHFHFHKVERFCVLRGEARIEMRQVLTDKTVTFDVRGDTPCFVDMPTLWTHNITNIGDTEMLTLFWTHEIFNPDAPDTYAVQV